MKKFMKEITLFIIQLLIFYLFPLFAKQIDAIGMVLFLITATFVLSALMESSQLTRSNISIRL